MASQLAAWQASVAAVRTYVGEERWPQDYDAERWARVAAALDLDKPRHLERPRDALCPRRAGLLIAATHRRSAASAKTETCTDAIEQMTCESIASERARRMPPTTTSPHERRAAAGAAAAGAAAAAGGSSCVRARRVRRRSLLRRQEARRAEEEEEDEDGSVFLGLSSEPFDFPTTQGTSADFEGGTRGGTHLRSACASSSSLSEVRYRISIPRIRFRFSVPFLLVVFQCPALSCEFRLRILPCLPSLSLGGILPLTPHPVSYTHLTLPTKA